MDDGGGEVEVGGETLVGLVGAHGDAFEFPGLAEEALDQAASFVHLLVDGQRPGSARVLATQTWRQDFGRFADRLVLPLTPVSAIVSVSCFGAGNMQQTLDPGAILPLAPYLDTLRWVFVVVTLAGIGITIYARLDDGRRGRR